MPPNDGAQPETDADAVRRVQRALVDLGYLLSSDEIDGNYGNRTATAVSRFKFDRGISPSNGIVGPKTTKALDEEFPPGSMTAGLLFAPFVTAKRLDADLAGLLNELMGLALLPWAGQTAVFALQELGNLNLAGIARASHASDLKPHVPVTEHASIDAIAVQLQSASTANGPFAMATRFEEPNGIRGHLIFQDAFVDRAALGGERHLGAMLSLSHELIHFRNRVVAKSLHSEPVTSGDYVDVAKANAFSAVPGNGSTTTTRATFIEEIGCRHLAWKVYQDLVIHHAQSMLAAGVITRPAAVSELTTNLQSGQLFRSAIKFATDGAQPNQTYFDNGYMSDLLSGAVTTFNRQVAIWMRTANQFIYHNDAACTDEIRNTFANEFNSQSPGFATPTTSPAGLISA